VAAFYNDFRNQQASVFVPTCTNQPTCAPVGINGIQNIGHSRLKGFEVESTLLVTDAFRIELGYAYLDAKVKSTSIPACDPLRFACVDASFLLPGDRLFFAPKNRYSLTGTYTLPLDEALGTVAVSATFTHTDSQVFSHADDHAAAIGAIPFNPTRVPNTDLLDLNLNWTNVGRSGIDLAIFATNVTKQKYYVAGTNGLSSTGGEFIVLGEPRMFGARLKYNFGR
jgi:iron complex outermembrane receptor protein